jgi:cystathionine gamma-synthase
VVDAVRLRDLVEVAVGAAVGIAWHDHVVTGKEQRADDGVSQVFYPGLPTHVNHDVAAKQMKRFGGMVSFRMRRGEDAAVKACAAVQLWTLGESLGGVESLIEHPARMTHASVAGTELEVPADLIRLSVGIEDVDDLIEDLREALDIHG